MKIFNLLGKSKLNSKRKVLFIILSYVELDNFLPIIAGMKNCNKLFEVDILYLGFDTSIFETNFFRSVYSNKKILRPTNSIDSSFVRIIFDINFYIFNFLYYLTKWKFLLHILRIIEDSLIQIIPKKYIKLDNFFNKFDYYFSRLGVIDLIQGDVKRKGMNSSLHKKISWKKSYYNKLILCYETFNQYRGNKEYSEVREFKDKKYMKKIPFVLSQGLKGNRDISFFKKSAIIDIGCPRYSEHWCNRLDEFYTKSSKLKTDSNLLYIANKASPNEKWAYDYIISQNNYTIKYAELERFKNLLIKKHPRNNISLKYWKNLRSKAVTCSFVDNLETSFLISKCNTLITAGSSVIPHALWLNKKVILLPDWAKYLGNTFIFSDFCLQVTNNAEKWDLYVNCHKKRINFLKKHTQMDLINIEYKRFLQEQIKKIGKAG